MTNKLINRLKDVTQSLAGSKLIVAPKQPDNDYETSLLLVLPETLYLNKPGDLYLGIIYNEQKRTYTVDDDQNITDNLTDSEAPVSLRPQIVRDLTTLAHFNNLECEELTDDPTDFEMRFYDQTDNQDNVKVIVANFCDFIRDVRQHFEKQKEAMK